MKSTFLCFAVAGVLFVKPAPTHAITITFEGKSGSAFGVGQFIDVDGYRFTNTGGAGVSFTQITNAVAYVETATTKFFAANQTEIMLSKVDGGAFNLLSLDLGGSLINTPQRWASSVDLLAGASALNMALPNTPTYVTGNPGFFGVTSVSFIPIVNVNQGINNYEFTLDNIVVTDAAIIPEPATATLGMMAIGGLMLRRRCLDPRRRSAFHADGGDIDFGRNSRSGRD